jgi:hypothetical protein
MSVKADNISIRLTFHSKYTVPNQRDGSSHLFIGSVERHALRGQGQDGVRGALVPVHGDAVEGVLDDALQAGVQGGSGHVQVGQDVGQHGGHVGLCTGRREVVTEKS